MQIKELRRHLFCNVELNYYSDGTVALECASCGKTLLLFCRGECEALVVKPIAFEAKSRAASKRKKKSGKRLRKHSKEFQEKIEAVCQHHNSRLNKPLDFSKPDFRDLKNLSNFDDS